MNAPTPCVVRAFSAAMALCGIRRLPLNTDSRSANRVATVSATLSGRSPGVNALRSKSASSEPWFGPLTDVTEATLPGAVAAA
ncbi:hypothetical protein D3C78_1704710 [compost metagenome]